MEAATDRPLLRIGELSRRVQVSDHLLRAWESRYGLLHPMRSPGGFPLPGRDSSAPGAAPTCAQRGPVLFATGIGGAALLGISLSTKPGSRQFYMLTMGLAAPGPPQPSTPGHCPCAGRAARAMPSWWSCPCLPERPPPGCSTAPPGWPGTSPR